MKRLTKIRRAEEYRFVSSACKKEKGKEEAAIKLERRLLICG